MRHFPEYQPMLRRREKRRRLRIAVTALVLAIALVGTTVFLRIQSRQVLVACALSRAVAAGDQDAALGDLAHGANTDAPVYVNLPSTNPVFAAFYPFLHMREWGTELELSGQPAMVELLLDHGANANERDGSGETPLMAAVTAGNLPVVQLLLSHGANPNLPGADSDTPLNAALMSTPDGKGGDSEQIARLLIGHGADVNAEGLSGVRPLGRAVAWRDEAMGCFLVENGASPTIEIDGQPPLIAAMRQNLDATATLLIAKGADPNCRDTVNGDTPLMVAVTGNDTTLVGDLVVKGANINGKNNAGETALAAAAQMNNVAMASALLRHNANPNLADSTGATPLIKNASLDLLANSVRPRPPASQDVLKQPASQDDARQPAPPDLLGILLRHRPARTQMAQLLIDHGANVNAVDQAGNSALVYAVGEGNTPLAQLLLDQGAYTDKVDSQGEDLITCARMRGYLDIAQLISKHDQAARSASSD